MSISVLDDLYTTYMAAIGAAASGFKRAALVASVSTYAGTGWKFILRRDGSDVLRLVGSGALPVSGTSIVINTANIASTELKLAADLDTGSWTGHIAKADGTLLLSGTAGASGTDFIVSGDIASDSTILLSSITFTPPASLDAGGVGEAPSGITLSVADIQSDIQLQAVQQHDYLPAVVPTGYDWYLGWRGRNGGGDSLKQSLPFPNPPSGFSAQVGWGEFFTDRFSPPGSHNWGIQISRLVTLELRGGTWYITRSVTQRSEMEGLRFINYNPQTSGSITTRVNGAGQWEVFMPDEGGVFHFWENPRSSIVGTGASDRACVVISKLVVWNPGLADDRASARVTCHAGIDYWRTTSAPFLQDYSNNSDMGISRARVLATNGSAKAYTVTANCRDFTNATNLRNALLALGVI